MFNLPDNDIAIIGDLHQDTGWAVTAIRSLKKTHPHITTYIQVGDFGLGVGTYGASYLRKVNKYMAGRKMFVVLGNHDNYDKYGKAEPSEEYPGTNVLKEAPNIHFFDRQAWFNANGKSFLTVVGANSINRQDLNPEDRTLSTLNGIVHLKSWWKEEQITEEDVTTAVFHGEKDILISHDVPTQGFPLTEEEASVGREIWGNTAVAYAELSGEQLQRILQQVKPETVIHGHFHKRSTITSTIPGTEKETTFQSLGMNGDLNGNIIILKQDGTLQDYQIEV